MFSSDLHEVGGVHAGQVHTPWACRKGCAQRTTIQGNDGDTDSFAIPEPEDDNDSAILESPDKSSDSALRNSLLHKECLVKRGLPLGNLFRIAISLPSGAIDELIQTSIVARILLWLAGCMAATANACKCTWLLWIIMND